MRIAVTGACGFVMSVFIRRLLESTDDASVTGIDLRAPDPLLRAYFAGFHDRMDFRTADIRDASAVGEALTQSRPDVVVHGATLTHVPEWERQRPVEFLDVNVMGTAHVLDAARRVPTVRRVVQVSSAAVYGAGSPHHPGEQPEETPLEPDEMYGVSKVASELVAGRFATLHGLDVPVLRFTKVFGPMERASGSRLAMSLPFHLARSRVTGERLTVTPRTLRAGGDWISAVDVAEAMVRLATAQSHRHTAYNLASGRFATVPELVDAFGAEVTADSRGGFDMDPALRSGKDGTYAVGRAASQLGWAPRQLSTQVDEYLQWAAAHPQVFNDPEGGGATPT